MVRDRIRLSQPLEAESRSRFGPGHPFCVSVSPEHRGRPYQLARHVIASILQFAAADGAKDTRDARVHSKNVDLE
jgi:imidazolonepropionase-like amidohydrolase